MSKRTRSDKERKAMFAKIKYYKVKNGKQTQINKPKNINSYLNKGYTVTKIEEKGNKTKINTYSPRTRTEYKKNLEPGTEKLMNKINFNRKVRGIGITKGRSDGCTYYELVATYQDGGSVSLDTYDNISEARSDQKKLHSALIDKSISDNKKKQ